jgi:uncharacterized cupredoxin-like copper-binding protein
MNRRHFSGAALALIAAAGPAAAHTGAHGPKTGPVKREQKPWGIAGRPGAVKRTVEVRMGDNMRFTPDRLAFRRGETVRLVVHNDGRVMHEFVLGDQKELDAHAELMKKFPNMEHDEPYMAHVEPGKKGEIVWEFNRAGSFRFACLIAGHYDAGMIGDLTVTA